MIESFSGVRGIYGKDISNKDAERYASAYCTHMKPKKIVIATDTRPSAPAIKAAFLKVFRHFTDVIDLEVCPTPTAEFAVRHFEADGGVIITASHNEPEFIGWKFLRSDGAVLSPEDMNEVISLAKTKIDIPSGKGVLTKGFIEDFYIDYVLGVIGIDSIEAIKQRKPSVLVDPNGGAASDIVKSLLKKLRCRATFVNDKFGDFKRKVEPNSESLSYLEVKDHDLAVGFDCDADRAEFVLPDGKMISGQHLLALVVDDVLSVSKGTVVINDCTSGMVVEVAKKHGCEVVEVEPGEINVVDKMYELNSPVGGEGSSSGAIVPPSRCRDGLMSLAFMLKILAEKKLPLSRIVNELPQYYTVRENFSGIDYPALKKKLKSKYSVIEHGDEFGSSKILFDDSYLWFRPSRTEPDTLRIIADSPSEERAKELLQLGKDIIS